ncbi:deoxycytidyl transferase [Neophaeococcomyces mojaviensis]|uniref:Deoxycytidyl transferase n=1 Tax=Neophaeococcomyces mojaviensis TaxID=3383035 RepID=A0ACC3A1I9_9EURO|nr:deoxycytidyl transferase [Knufia sp. JES_112]
MGSRLENNSKDVRKRIEHHTFDGEDGEEYSASKFGGFTDYMRRKKIKLQNLDSELRSQSTDKPKIFRGVVACVNGYTQPSLSDLHLLIVSHGGGFLQYLDGKTSATHIIASQLTPKKKAEFARYRTVKPAWIVDSVQAGRLLSWENYRLVDEGVAQKVLSFDAGRMTSQTNNQTHGYKDHSDTSWYASQVKDAAARINNDSQGSEVAGTSSHVSSDVPAQDGNGALAEETNVGNQSLDDQDFATPIQPPATITNDADPPPKSIDAHPDTLAFTPAVDNVGERLQGRQLTAEEHNAILLQNPHMAKSSTANPDFLNQYYRESRLHHLSTWKAELKAQLQARAQENSSRKAKPKTPPGTRRYVMHVDFDSFFAAVSLRKNPQFKDKPVVVAHGSGPGSEIASCNYPARKYGIKNGMWMKYALELCPDLKVLPYDYKAYEEASKHFYDSILAMDGIVQSISIDEALIDVSEQCIRAGGSDGRHMSEGSVDREQTKASELASSLRASVREKTGCEVSVGIGSNILLAKVALRKAKPAGQHLIKPEEVLDFLGELTVTDLPGVAHSIGNKLQEIGVKHVRDIRSLTKEKLITTLGPKTGEKIWDYARGIDRQEVGEQVIRKSVSAEVNWGIRFINQQQAEDFVHSLCEELSKRLLEQLVKGRQLTMKVMRKAADAGLDPPKNLGHGKCDTFNKSVALGVATNDKAVLSKEAVTILRSYNFPPGELRGLGVQMQRLEPLKASKDSEATPVDGSQRRLQFKKPGSATKTPDKTSSGEDADQKEEATLRQGKSFTSTSAKKIKQSDDPIEEAATPQKPMSLAEQHELSALEDAETTPLNISGTQFAVPSQIDPAVLAELPTDIRAKLSGKVPNSFNPRKNREPSTRADARPRSESPFVSDPEVALPSQSQLDPETLAELPDDVREELMAEYRQDGKINSSRRMQQLLPQSPRKGRPIAANKVNTTPTKKHKIKSLLSKSRPKTSNASLPTLTQANFVSVNTDNTTNTAEVIFADEELSTSFLEELPESIRLEIFAEQKRHRMEQKSGLSVSNSRKRPRAAGNADEMKGQQKLNLPRLPPKPTFTSRKLSTLPELRETMSAWVQTFSTEDEQGPFQEDTDALGLYLRQVVLDEGDMSKAQAVLDWLAYVVRDWPFPTEQIRVAWQHAMSFLKAETQQAVRERGLAPLEFR